jgi:hypothetical protein
MKKLIFLSVFFLAVNTSAQVCSYLRAVTLNSNVYTTKVDMPLKIFASKDGTLVNQKDVTIKPKAGTSFRYKIIGTDGDFTIIKLLPRVKINEDNSITVDDPTTDAENGTEFLYFKKTSEFGLNQKNLLSEKIVGTPLIYPYKLRLQDKGEGASITTEFTVGYTFGLRLKLGSFPSKQNFFTIVPYGFGLGNTKYFYQQSDGTLTEKKDAVAITYYTGGILFTINKVNIGFFAGQDAMIDKQNNWAYQGNWWYSIGLGYKFKTD